MVFPPEDGIGRAGHAYLALYGAGSGRREEDRKEDRDDEYDDTRDDLENHRMED